MTKSQQPGDQPTKRYPAANFAAISSGLHTGDAGWEITPSPRDYSDPEKLQRLYAFGIALQNWAARFESDRVKEISAGSVDFLSLQRLLQYVKEQVAAAAPEAAAPDAASRPGQRAALQLDDAVFMAMQLPAFIEDNFTLRWEPVGPFPDGEVPADALFDAVWEPPDNPPASLVRDAMKDPVAAAVSADIWWMDFHQRVNRIGKLASDAIRNLIAHVNSDEGGGFSRGKVEEFVRSKPDQAMERRVHDGFMRTLESLALLASRKDAGQWMDWEQLTRELHERHGEWSDACFAPTVTGEKPHKIRSTRQSKKNGLRRLVSLVSQYGTLLRGAVAMRRISAVIEGLSVLGAKMQVRVKKMCGEVTLPTSTELQRQVWLLDQQAVAAGNLEHWKRCLGPRAETCGRLVELIACGDVPQAEPWEPKEHASQLKTAAIFEKTDPDKEFDEIRLRMQAAGIAIQAPWKYIEGKRAEPETKEGVADKWLLNPMAQILAPELD